MSCRALDASKCLHKLALCRCRAARSCLIVPMELSNRDFFLCFTYTPALLFRLNHRFVRVYTLPLHVTIIWPTGLVDSASWGCSWRHFLLSETIRKTLTMWALNPPPVFPSCVSSACYFAARSAVGAKISLGLDTVGTWLLCKYRLK